MLRLSLFLQVGCFVDYDAHSAMYGLSAFLLALLLVVLAGLIHLQRAPATGSHVLRIRRVVGLLLLATYLVYPFACKLLFSTFNCDTVDGMAYLHSDLSVECDSDEHQRAEAFASFMIAAFPVGLPALYFLMLSLNRNRLFSDDGHMGFLFFFYREYEERYYYWCVSMIVSATSSLLIIFDFVACASGRRSNACASACSWASPPSFSPARCCSSSS